MTDAGLVAKKLTLIERYLGELRSQARPERLFDDVKEERFIVHTLQLATQAALDLGIVRSVVTSHLSDFENFVAVVRARIDGV